MTHKLLQQALEALDGGHIDRAYGYIFVALAQPQREWVGLTKAEMFRIDPDGYNEGIPQRIEAKLKKKNT